MVVVVGGKHCQRQQWDKQPVKIRYLWFQRNESAEYDGWFGMHTGVNLIKLFIFVTYSKAK
jgi:hypothetical protein